MSWEAVERRFREAGVPLRLVELPWFRVDVERNRGGERILLCPARASVQVMDADAGQEQLLLLVKDRDGYGRPTKQKILCGRDERSLFAVTVPNRFGVAVNTVAAAHEALKPAELRADESEAGGRRGRGVARRRKGRAALRQGDWFFVPCPWVRRDLTGIRKRVRLGFGNPHVVDYLVGDERQFSTGFGWGRFGTSGVLARGFVRHREHRPLNLRCWHRVLPNAAIRAPGGYAD